MKNTANLSHIWLNSLLPKQVEITLKDESMSFACRITSPFIIFTLFLFSIYTNADSDTALVGAIPEWVNPIRENSLSEYEDPTIEGGIYHLLVDVQVRAEEERASYFFHYSNHILNQTGVENNSQINIDFDPSYEQVVLHNISLYRGDEVLDRTDSSKSILHREKELESLIYDGRKTLNIILDDVRAGDVLDYSFSIIGDNPVYRNLFAYEQYLQWQVPVRKASFRLLWEKPGTPSIEMLNSSAEIEAKKTSSGVEYLVQQSPSKPRYIEEDTPEWFEPWANVHVSELGDWESVARWGASLYDDAYISNPEIERLAASIMASHLDQRDQVFEALNFVQSEIRYMGIELGTNSHNPSPATETFSRRFGDCKDKTVLLIVLLQQLGIEAVPALVSTTYRGELMNRPVSTRAFNHVITKVKLDSESIYLDPTLSLQEGGLSNIHYPSYGAALDLEPGTKGLSLVPANKTERAIDIVEHYVISDSPSKPSTARLETTFRGASAKRQRRYLSETSIIGVQDSYLEYFENYYGKAEVAEELKVSYDSDANLVSTLEAYELSELWEPDSDSPGRFDTRFYANMVSSYVTDVDSSSRQDPLYLGQPIRVSQRINIEFPDDNWFFEDESKSESNAFFDFEYSAKFDAKDKALQLFFSYVVKSTYVSPEKYSEYRQLVRDVESFLSYGMYWDTNYVEPESNILSSITPVWGVLAYFFLYLILFFVWRYSQKKRPAPQDGDFFPVAPAKFIFMWIVTFGIYGCYWFYRQFKYLRSTKGQKIKPVLRAIFYPLFYYSLYKSLVADSIQRFDSNRLPGKALAILLAIVFLIVSAFSSKDPWTMLSLVVGSMLLLPFVLYIYGANKEAEQCRHNSRFTSRHYVLGLVSLPLLLLTFSAELGITPSDSVVPGSRLLSHDISKLQKRGVLKADEEIILFYSSGFLSNQEDGNGFTNKGVFSYWMDESGNFNIRKADYSEIREINPTMSKKPFSDSSITIVKRDGAEFILLVSNLEGKDVSFTSELRKHWHENR